MKRIHIEILLLASGALGIALLSNLLIQKHGPSTHSGKATIAGSESCKECHQRFYDLWEPSHHGKAMQPYTEAFAKSNLTAQPEPIIIGDISYQADISGSKGWIIEKGPNGSKRYEILHAMGGKNVFFFLTPLERGRLQVLPLAYRIGPNEWYDTTGSMLRHFGEDQPQDEAIDWRDPMLTFNTACYGCHVSQLSKNYDPDTDTYNTVWSEPGINCETCHGPASEHNRVCREAPKGTVPEDLKIPLLKDITPLQWDETCAPCHAKMRSITTTFKPGDRYFDHYGLVTLEDPDFYPDGRDLGENYTYTGWLKSPCVTSGQLSCMHCHTSSGRYRFKSDIPAEANKACLPCHQARVDNAEAHTRHPSESAGNKCISCHMPMTSFSHMRRSDHSMLPPTPSATIEFNSQNACNICHTDQSAKWADSIVREWHEDDYQAPVMRQARLIDEARKDNWTHLDDMLAVIADSQRDEITVTSLIRILVNCPDPKKWPAIRGAMHSKSPLVRSAAAQHLRDNLVAETIPLLLAAVADDFRIVRIEAATALQRYPRARLSPTEASQLDAATEEYKIAMMTQPDHWSSHFNMGNFYTDRGEITKAIAAYDKSSALRSDTIQPLVNAAILHAREGRPGESIAQLRKALIIEPENQAVNFNLGLALAEQNDMEGAESCLRKAAAGNAAMPEAAYNLGVLLAAKAPSESLSWLRKAVAQESTSGKYAYTLAFYLNHGGNAAEAITVLNTILDSGEPTADCYLLLGSLYEDGAKIKEAKTVYEKAAADTNMPVTLQRHAQMKLYSLQAE